MKQKIFTALLAISLLVSIPLSASATEVTPVGTSQEAQSSVSNQVDIQPRADVIEWKYQISLDGRLYMRRWNVTRNRWEDPSWIEIPKAAV